MIDMVSVHSAHIESIGYSDARLFVQFLSGGTYIYYGVPEYIHEGIMSALSKSDYFRREIKGVYEYAKISFF